MVQTNFECLPRSAPPRTRRMSERSRPWKKVSAKSPFSKRSGKRWGSAAAKSPMIQSRTRKQFAGRTVFATSVARSARRNESVPKSPAAIADAETVEYVEGDRTSSNQGDRHSRTWGTGIGHVVPIRHRIAAQDA